MIRKAETADARTLAQLANHMWTDSSVEELLQGFAELMTKKDALLLLKIVDGVAVGFAQCQLRYDYVEGMDSSPVGYLEGIFVQEEYRNRGYAKELLEACEHWAREMGGTEFASDCELDNTASLAFHKALHFQEANRIICFTKSLV